MVLGKQFIVLYLAVQLAYVCASASSSSHEAEHIANESTVTTDMAYYESESMSGKTQSYHDEYEYVAAPEPKYSKKGKSSKKSRYHHGAEHTMEPTEHFSYTSAPTELDSYKGKTDGGRHKSRKSGNHYEEEYAMEYSSFSMESIVHSSSKGSKKETRVHLTHAPAHSPGKGMDGNFSKRSKAGKSGHDSSKDGKRSKNAKKGGAYETPAPCEYLTGLVVPFVSNLMPLLFLLKTSNRPESFSKHRLPWYVESNVSRTQQN